MGWTSGIPEIMVTIDSTVTGGIQDHYSNRMSGLRSPICYSPGEEIFWQKVQLTVILDLKKLQLDTNQHTTKVPFGTAIFSNQASNVCKANEIATFC